MKTFPTRALIGFFAVIVAVGIVMTRSNADPGIARTNQQQQALMRAKLASTQRIVEGLVSKDFDDIAKGADELMKICKANEWKAHSDDVYSHHRRELMKQVEKMSNSAATHNLEGAAYSYIHTVTTCISCHDYCRDTLKIAEAESRSKVVPIPTAEDESSPSRRTVVR